MARAGPMKDREVWIQAGAILATYDERSMQFIVDQLCEAIGDRVAVDDWRRVAAAVDAIRATSDAAQH